MKWKLFVLVALLFAVVFSAIAVPTAFAQGSMPPALPSLSEILTMTVAAAVAMLLSAGIPAAIAYLIGLAPSV